MGEIDQLGKIMHDGWQFKKMMANGISNSEIDAIYETAMQNGATGGKISGAGGGGYFFFYCPLVSRTRLIESLVPFVITVQQYHFTKEGLYTYTVNR